MQECSFIFLYSLSKGVEDLRDDLNAFIEKIDGEYIGTTAYLFRCNFEEERNDKIEKLEEYIQSYFKNRNYNSKKIEYSFWKTNRNPIKEDYYPQ